MRILVAARHPGPAEAVSSVAQELQKCGHEVLLVGLRNDTDATKIHGGSATIFQRRGVPFVELGDINYGGDVTKMPVEFGEGLIGSFKPDGILVGCSLDLSGEHIGIEDVLIIAGARNSINVVQIVESWDAWNLKKYNEVPSRYALMDEIHRKILVKQGISPEQIVITGHPGLDEYKPILDHQRGVNRQRLGLEHERLVVFFGQAEVTKGEPDHSQTLVWVVDALDENDRLIFSQHPRDTRDHSEVLARAGNNLLPSHFTSDQLLSIADMAVTHYSTMGIKAALSGVSTLNVLLPEDWASIREICGGFPLSLLGGSREAHSYAEFRDILATPFTTNVPNLRHALNLDGLAAKRVGRMLTETIR
jgi:hypothetical protein